MYRASSSLLIWFFMLLGAQVSLEKILSSMMPSAARGGPENRQSEAIELVADKRIWGSRLGLLAARRKLYE
jgi:hypothetical protein